MPTVRTRSASVPYPRGRRITKSTQAELVYTGIDLSAEVQDYVGNPYGYMNQFFSSISNRVSYRPSQRDFETSLYLYKMHLPSCCTATFAKAHIPGDFKYSALEAMASSHPGEPAISIPNFLYEFKDFPRMAKNYAKLVRDFKSGRKKRPTSGDAAREWLAYNFGWAPLFSDLNDIFEVSKGVERQARRLARIRSRGYVSTRGFRGEYTERQKDNHVVFDTSTSTFGTEEVETNSKSWTSARWIETNHPPLTALLTSSPIQRMYLDQLGLDVSFSTVWDAIPWSWLVDWTTDVSSIARIHSNRAGFLFSRGVVMTHTTTRTTVTSKGSTQWSGANVGLTRESKIRGAANPNILNAGINILSAKQLATLGSLLLAKNR